MTLAPNVVDLDESNLPHYTNPKLSKKQTLIEPKANTLNSLSSSSTDDYSEDGLIRNHTKIKNQTTDNRRFNLIDEKLKQLKLSNDLDKYKQLSDLKNKLIEEQMAKNVNQKNQNYDVKELKEMLKTITNHLDTNENIENNEELALVATRGSHKNAKSSTLMNLNDELDKALLDLEHKLIDFESLTGKNNQQKNFMRQNSNKSISNGLTSSSSGSYTLSLIQVVSNLLDYLKETAVELNYEKIKQVELNKQLDIHRKLIDGLTTEILCVKEQNEKIANDYVNQNAKLEAELNQIKVKYSVNVKIFEHERVLQLKIFD
jgi:hypothetical protein